MGAVRRRLQINSYFDHGGPIGVHYEVKVDQNSRDSPTEGAGKACSTRGNVLGQIWDFLNFVRGRDVGSGVGDVDPSLNRYAQASA